MNASVKQIKFVELVELKFYDFCLISIPKILNFHKIVEKTYKSLSLITTKALVTQEPFLKYSKHVRIYLISITHECKIQIVRSAKEISLRGYIVKPTMHY